MLAEKCFKNGFDVPIYACYFKKKERQYIFDAPVKYSTLKVQFGSRDAIAEYLCNRCNIIRKFNGDMQYVIPEPEQLRKTA